MAIKKPHQDKRKLSHTVPIFYLWHRYVSVVFQLFQVTVPSPPPPDGLPSHTPIAPLNNFFRSSSYDASWHSFFPNAQE